MAHIGLLHGKGSSRPTNISSQADCIPFHPYFTWKDVFGLVGFVGFLGGVIIISPDLFREKENFEIIDRLHTPTHIQPEWYFLYAYTVLRTIQNKVGGISCILAAVLVLYCLPYVKKNKIKGSCYNLVGQALFWLFCRNMVVITFIGTQAPSYPYDVYSYSLIVFHFLFMAFYVPLSQL